MAIIPYADVIDRQYLPIDAQDVVTRVQLVIAGGPAGETPARTHVGEREEIGPWEAHSSFPRPITLGYQSAMHPTYGATRSFSLPPGVNPFLPPNDPRVPEPNLVMNMSNPGSPSAIRDGDPLTYAQGTGGQTMIQYGAANQGWCGFKLRYSLVTPTPIPALNRSVFVAHYNYSGTDVARALSSRAFELRPTESLDEPAEMYAVTMHDARGESINRDGEVLGKSFTAIVSVAGVGDHTLRITEFYPLVLNQPLLSDIARAQVRYPGQTPTRVTVRGIVPPDRAHTITGWPGGDYTGQVAQVQYELGRTIIDFEQAGAPAGLPAEAMEAARERQSAIKNEIAVAGYSLKMGERQ